MVIEESSLERANKKLEEVTKDYSDYCECCGKRWYPFDEYDEKETIDIEIHEFFDRIVWEEISYVLYKADGTKEKVVLREGIKRI